MPRHNKKKRQRGQNDSQRSAEGDDSVYQPKKKHNPNEGSDSCPSDNSSWAHRPIKKEIVTDSSEEETNDLIRKIKEKEIELKGLNLSTSEMVISSSSAVNKSIPQGNDQSASESSWDPAASGIHCSSMIRHPGENSFNYEKIENTSDFKEFLKQARRNVGLDVTPSGASSSVGNNESSAMAASNQQMNEESRKEIFAVRIAGDKYPERSEGVSSHLDHKEFATLCLEISRQMELFKESEAGQAKFNPEHYMILKSQLKNGRAEYICGSKSAAKIIRASFRGMLARGLGTFGIRANLAFLPDNIDQTRPAAWAYSPIDFESFERFKAHIDSMMRHKNNYPGSGEWQLVHMGPSRNKGAITGWNVNFIANEATRNFAQANMTGNKWAVPYNAMPQIQIKFDGVMGDALSEELKHQEEQRAKRAAEENRKAVVVVLSDDDDMEQ